MYAPHTPCASIAVLGPRYACSPSVHPHLLCLSALHHSFITGRSTMLENRQILQFVVSRTRRSQ